MQWAEGGGGGGGDTEWLIPMLVISARCAPRGNAVKLPRAF